MSETVANKQGISPLLSYSAISIALLLPLLLWPLQELSSGGLSPELNLQKIWVVTACTLLLCAVTADSILCYLPDSPWPFFATAWILATSMAVSIALRSEAYGAHIIATMFALHTMRSGLRLWQQQEKWWHGPALGRDMAASLSMFTWIIILG